MVFTDKLTGEEITRVRVQDGEQDGELYGYYCPARIKKYADDIVVTIIDDQNELIPCRTAKGVDYTEGYIYSVKQYATNKMTANNTEKMRNLARSLYNYGIAAKVCFTWRDWQSVTVPAEVKAVTENQLNAYASSSTGSKPAGISKVTTNVDFGADNSLYVYFTLDEGKKVTDYVFTLDNETVVPVLDSGNKYCIAVNNVPAKNLGDMHTFAVSRGGVTYTLKYSVLSYAKNKIKNGAEETRNLCKALYLYYQASKAYFGN